MAEEKVTKIMSSYLENFRPDVFLAVNSSIHDDFNKTFIGLHHEVFSALKPGERLLDVGSGPGLRNLVSASAKYQNITLSDPVPQNRHMLQKYMDDVTEDQRWTEHFKLTAELEGDVQKWPEVRDRMRARIKHVAWCDILQDEPLGKDQPEELFDCVMTTLTLGTASAGGDMSTYTMAVKNLVSLAKPGAPVVIADALYRENAYYYVGDTTFDNLPVTEAQVRQCVEAAGCVVLSYRETQPASLAIFILEARKL